MKDINNKPVTRADETIAKSGGGTRVHYYPKHTSHELEGLVTLKNPNRHQRRAMSKKDSIT